MITVIKGQMRMSEDWVEMSFQNISTKEEMETQFDTFEYDSTFSNYRLIVDGEIKRDWLKERK